MGTIAPGVEEGDAYIFKVREQLEFSRSMHSAWHDDEPMADDVNWFEGGALSKSFAHC